MKHFITMASLIAALPALWAETELSDVASGFHFVGDSITLPQGSYTVLGDGIASLSGNVVTCKKAGFTLLNDGSADYRLCVVPRPSAGGDVFYWYNNDGNGQNWTSVAWTKVTSNSDRTYPNGPHDIAVVEGACNWAKMLVNDAISVHGYVVGVPKIPSGDSWVQLETANSQTLTFCGTEKDPAFMNLSSMHAGKSSIRVGTEKGTDPKVLGINVAAKRMLFDWCGDSADVASPYRRDGAFSMCSVVINIPAGNTLEFVNESKKVTDRLSNGQTTVGHFSGEGTLIIGKCTKLIQYLGYAGDPFAGKVSVASGEWENALVDMPAADLCVQGAPNHGRSRLYVGYTTCTENPGVSQIDVKSLELDGGFLQIARNYADNAALASWTQDVTSVEQLVNNLTVTNQIRKLVLKGDSAIMCEVSFGDLRVRQYAYLDEIVRPDSVGTLVLYDFNFRDKVQRTSPYYDRVLGDGLAPYAVGREPAAGDSQYIYRIIPWIACTINDNNYAVYNSWGSQLGFPGLVNGALYSMQGRGSRSLRDVQSEWENVQFLGKGIQIPSDVTVNSFVYDTAEAPQYPANLVLGKERKLTIKSGGMIFTRNNRWFGATQTAQFNNCGTVEFGGEHAYLFSDYGVPENASNGDDWNVMWASMVAPNGLVKGGCGELVVAADQRGIDGKVWINGGTLWLGHPGNYRQKGWLYAQQASNAETVPIRGCVTDVDAFVLHAGAVLGVPIKGYDVDGDGEIGASETAIPPASEIRLTDNAAGTSRIEIAAGADQTCMRLYVNGVTVPSGTYGASGSGAQYIDDDHFAGTGVLRVRKDDLQVGLTLFVR